MPFEIIDTFPKCSACLHKIPMGAKCAAFPKVIPLEIRNGQFDHRNPWPNSENPRDNGIRFKPIGGDE